MDEGHINNVKVPFFFKKTDKTNVAVKLKINEIQPKWGSNTGTFSGYPFMPSLINIC